MTKVAEKLMSVGIEVYEHKRKSPNFILSRQGRVLRINVGKGEVTVSTDKRKRQAVITVVEPARTVPAGTVYVDYVDRKRKGKIAQADALEWFKNKLGKDFNKAIRRGIGLVVPGSRLIMGDCVNSHVQDHWTYDYEKGENVKDGRSFSAGFKVSLRTSKTTTTFLVGYDESSSDVPFICQLKKPVSTVKEAHEELLPKNVKLDKKHKRQGEWFFNPVSQKLNKELFSKRMKTQRLGEQPTQWWQAKGSHEATVVKHKNKTYAIGTVKDTRKGHHEPLVLTSFHEVIRNNEVVIPETEPQNRRWD